MLAALATILGTIIGVGLFGLPYAFVHAGWALSLLYLFGVGTVVWLVHLAYADLVSQTDERLEYAGYIRQQLGSRWARLALILQLLALVGALAAYLLVGGTFLTALLGSWWGGTPLIGLLLYWAVSVLVLAIGRRAVAGAELWLISLFFIVLAVLVGKALGLLQVGNFTLPSPDQPLLPYGVVLFSLWGLSVISELEQMLAQPRGRGAGLAGRERLLRRVVSWGIWLSVATYLVFTLSVIGLSGSATSPDALAGLAGQLGPLATLLAYLFGLLTTFTSSIALSLVLEQTIRLDFGQRRWVSWLAAALGPLLLSFAVQDFLGLISLVGAVALGSQGVLVLLAWRRSHAGLPHPLPSPPRLRWASRGGTTVVGENMLGHLNHLAMARWLVWPLSGILVAGVALELVRTWRAL